MFPVWKTNPRWDKPKNASANTEFSKWREKRVHKDSDHSLDQQMQYRAQLSEDEPLSCLCVSIKCLMLLICSKQSETENICLDWYDWKTKRTSRQHDKCLALKGIFDVIKHTHTHTSLLLGIWHWITLPEENFVLCRVSECVRKSNELQLHEDLTARRVFVFLRTLNLFSYQTIKIIIN